MQNYSFIQKQLHRFILKNKNINKSLFILESIFFKNYDNIKNNKHTFVVGLPRSGTTALLNYLYNTKKFASLTYDDMPFVMCPNFASFFPKKELLRKERSHGDGIKINNYSPEALDEIFFRTFKEKELKKYFERYVSLILMKYSKKIYLSKNNSNYKRLNLIKSIFVDANIFILYRDPLDQASSLLEQHIKFCKIQSEDKFVLDYMNYLGHYEFGLNYKPWNFSENYRDHLSLNHWLEQWFVFYKNIIELIKNHNNVYLVSYDDLCRDNNLIKKILKILNIKYENSEYFINQKKVRDIKYSDDIFKKCYELIDELNSSKYNLKTI